MSIAETFGTRDDPVPTGELYAMNADGGRRQLLVGFRATGPQFGSRIGVRKEGDLAAFLIDTLPHDRDHVLVKLRPFTKDPVTYVARLNVYDGRRTRVTAVSVLEADYMTDSRGGCASVSAPCRTTTANCSTARTMIRPGSWSTTSARAAA